MSSGNSNAITVLMDILRKGDKIDPDDAFGGLGSLMNLDRLNIWEHRIWMLYKDVCKNDLKHKIAIIRANKLRFINK